MSSHLERHPLFVRIVGEVLLHLKASEQRLSALLPSAKVSIFSGPVGAATSFQAAHIGIACLLADIPASAPDEVALIVTLCHLDREPRLNADVCWGYPDSKVEVSLSGAEGSSDDWPFATEERMQELLTELPRMIEIFEAAARRGCP